MKCKYHYCEKEIEGRTKKAIFCSWKCKNTYHVDKRRRKLKQMSVEYKGGKCEKCGYNKCPWVLEFHHKDKLTKEFEIGHCHTRSWEKIKTELDKCEIMCSNCHREAEYEEKKLTKNYDWV